MRYAPREDRLSGAFFRAAHLAIRPNPGEARKNNAKFARTKREMAVVRGIRDAGTVESRRKIRYNKRKLGCFPMRAANMDRRMSMGLRTVGVFADIP